MDFNQALQKELERTFASQPRSPGAQRLREAMAYSLLGQGKRIRPRLVLESARACSESLSEREIAELAMPAAIAVEYVHTYSLIHDDLPAMDDDDIRRGKPSSHRRFDEATAVLAGDALLSDAFGVLAHARIKPAKQCAELSLAIGSRGMVLGQLDDLMAKSPTQSHESLLEIHHLKTGCLFACAAVLGALSVDASSDLQESMRRYGSALGLAFQLVDDCLDQSPLVEQLGEAEVQRLAEEQTQIALQAIEPLGAGAESLRQLALSALQRRD